MLYMKWMRHVLRNYLPFRTTRVHPPVRVTRFLVFCVMFCRSLFVPLSFYFWPLYCLSFLLIKIAHLVFSNSSLINEPSNQTVENPLPTQ